MRIAIDAHWASYELRGMGKYIVQLVSGLVTTDKSNEYVVYGDSRKFPQPNGCNNVRYRNPGNVPYPLWEQFMLPRWMRQDRIELLHCPANTAPFATPRHVELVITIHDVMYLLPTSVLSGSKVLRQRLGNFYRRTMVPTMAPRASRIITISAFSKRGIAEHLRIAPDRISVVPLGVDPKFGSFADTLNAGPKAIGEESLEGPFILVLGSSDPRKNTLTAIRVYASIWRALPNQEKLVIVGLRDWRSSAAYQLATELGVEKRILFAGYVSEGMLAWLYSNSRCFLYPTLYEGFGFPVLEAMACGTPVITSDCTSVPEVAGDAAILVNPASEKSIGDALLRLLQDELLRCRLIESGKDRVLKFGWQGTVQKTLEVYAELSGHENERALAASTN